MTARHLRWLAIPVTHPAEGEEFFRDGLGMRVLFADDAGPEGLALEVVSRR